MDDGTEFLSILYHALRAPRRRRTIWHVATSKEAVIPIRQLAREIAAEELRVRPELATGEPYRNVYNALSQTHLPTLAEAGILIYDPKRQTISRGTNLAIAALLIATNDAAVESLERSSTLGGENIP
ncbi:DUF7344 domain-containing protein [Haloplanus vescus]